jgi:hypothetical protein
VTPFGGLMVDFRKIEYGITKNISSGKKLSKLENCNVWWRNVVKYGKYIGI